MKSHSLQTHREFYSDDRDHRGHLKRRAQQATLDENSVQRELYSTENDKEIQDLKRRNSEYALFQSQHNHWKPINGPIKLSDGQIKFIVREYICAVK